MTALPIEPARIRALTVAAISSELLADATALLPLDVAEVFAESTARVIGTLTIELTAAGLDDRATQLQAAHQRCLDTLASRRLGERGGLT